MKVITLINMSEQTAELNASIQSIKEQVYGAAPIAQTEPIVNVDEPQPVITPTSEGSVADLPSNEGNNQAQSNEPVVTEPVITPIININDYLKGLGYQSEDDFKKEITELKKLKDTPPVIAPIEPEFVNEESKKIYQNLKAGNTKEVKAYLDAQELLANADSLQDEQKLKLFIKLQNPKFDKDLIDDEFNERYTFDEDNFTGDDLKLRKEKVKLSQRLEDDLLKAQDYFKQYQAKIELQNIEPTPAIDDNFKTYQENLAVAQEEHKVLLDKLSKISEKDINIKLNYADEASKINFDVDYKADKEGFDKAKDAVADYSKFLAENYYTQDGSPIVDKLTADIYKIKNFDKILAEAVNQAVNATRKSMVATQKNVDPNGQRNYVQNVPSEIDSYRRQVFGN